MFKGMKWWDWLLIFSTYGVWIIFVILRRLGFSFIKSIGIVFGMLVILFAIGYIYMKSDAGMKHDLNAAYRNDTLSTAETILKENPSIKLDNGMTAQEVVDDIKKNLATKKAKKETEEKKRIVLEKAKQKKIATDNGYKTYEAYLKGEKQRIAKEKLAQEKLQKKRLNIAQNNGYNSWNEYQRALNQPTMNAKKLRNIACTLLIPSTEMALRNMGKNYAKADSCTIDWNGESKQFFVIVKSNVGITFKYEYFDKRKHTNVCKNLKNTTLASDAQNNFGKCYREGEITVE